MAHFEWAAETHRQLSSLQERLETHEHEHSEVKRLQPLHSGLRKGLSTCLKAVESFVQPEFKSKRCLRCNRPFESVAVMVRESFKGVVVIGWCDACTIKRTGSSSVSAASSVEAEENESTSDSSGGDSDTEMTAPTKPPRKRKTQRSNRRAAQRETTETRKASTQDASPVLSASLFSTPPSLSLPSSPPSPPSSSPSDNTPPPALLSLAEASVAVTIPPPSPELEPTKPKRKGESAKGSGKNKKHKAPGELLNAPYQLDKKAIELTQIKRGAEAIVSRLSAKPTPTTPATDYKQSAADSQTFSEALSFVPGDQKDPFPNSLEASKMYVAQASFGRKMDLRCRYACGRCARPFNPSWTEAGGPTRFNGAAARREVASKDITFEKFCSEYLHAAAKVVRAEILFSVLCDQHPTLLAALIESSSQHFPWTLFVQHSSEAFQIWRMLLTQAPSLSPSSSSSHTTDDEFKEEAEPFPLALAVDSSQSESQSLFPALQQLVLATDSSTLLSSPSAHNPSTQVVAPVCAICLYALDVEHDVLAKDDEVPRERLESVARELNRNLPQVAFRRVRLDCGHEFCYQCALSHYLQTGNSCPLCMQRFTHIAHRPVTDRHRSQALNGQTRRGQVSAEPE